MRCLRCCRSASSSGIDMRPKDAPGRMGHRGAPSPPASRRLAPRHLSPPVPNFSPSLFSYPTRFDISSSPRQPGHAVRRRSTCDRRAPPAAAAAALRAHLSTLWLRGLRGSFCHRSKIMDLYCGAAGGAGRRQGHGPHRHQSSSSPTVSAAAGGGGGSSSSSSRRNSSTGGPRLHEAQPRLLRLQRLQLLRVVRLPGRLGAPAGHSSAWMDCG